MKEINTEVIEQNKKLIANYPFLKPYTGFWSSGDYDYSYTLIDDMPKGWKKAFGKQLCEEIRKDLVKCNYLDKYKIIQIKEKYGSLRIYDEGIPEGSKVWDIINKYEDMSTKICVICGEPATKISKGWICPYCNKCFEEYYPNGKYIEIKAHD